MAITCLLSSILVPSLLQDTKEQFIMLSKKVFLLFLPNHIHMTHTPYIQNSLTKFVIANLKPASQSLPEEMIRNVLRLDYTIDEHPERFFGVSSNFLQINNNSLPGLHFNYSSKYHCNFLTKTQVSETVDSKPPFSILNFYPKKEYCVHVRNDITCPRSHDLDSSGFSPVWVILNCHLKYIFVLFISLQSINTV